MKPVLSKPVQLALVVPAQTGVRVMQGQLRQLLGIGSQLRVWGLVQPTTPPAWQLS